MAREKTLELYLVTIQGAVDPDLRGEDIPDPATGGEWRTGMVIRTTGPEAARAAALGVLEDAGWTIDPEREVRVSHLEGDGPEGIIVANGWAVVAP